MATPDDISGRSASAGAPEWAFANFDGGVQKFLDGVLAGITVVPRGECFAQGLGTAFLVAGGEGEGLYITANHVIAAAKEFVRLPNQPHPSSPFAPVDDRSLGGACARKELCAHIVIDGEADFGTISSAYGLPGYDVAALIVKSRLIKPGMPALAINSDFILPGTSVIAVGLPRAGVRSVRQLGAGSRAIVYEHALEARAGKIRAVRAGHRAVRIEPGVYELSFPIPHGMSGGPVLLAPQSAEESAIRVIAFASYDHSTPSDVNDTNVPGEGIAVPIASALVTRSWSDATLLDGIRDQRVRDLGRSWPELEVVEHPETGYRVRRRVERAAR